MNQTSNGSNLAVQHYATRIGSYDETLTGSGEPQPHWQTLLRSLDELGGEKFEQRRREAQRLLRDNGVTYNVYDGVQGARRPWQLDPVPLLIDAAGWAAIESGLKQRAELFDLIFSDLYGEQQLLRKGLLPPELVYAHQGFLLPCMGQPQSGSRRLALHAVNLARGPDGQMWVVDDRTQAPSGAGYALENRTVMNRIMPELFHGEPIRRLAAFFRGLHDGLAELAPQRHDDPRVVVLTPGPYNETYFEHAYLASYLGYSLVQGSDLTVRDGRVWLKSLDGLRQVDVILRRVDDSFCDPLELRSESGLGVAGLLEAVRRGKVAVANPLGSSILENPALLPFLPSLCRHFLAEELKLPSVATWWCGQPRERNFVLDNLELLLIRRINRDGGSGTLVGDELTSGERTELRHRILAEPHLYVGQERVSFSTAPSLVGGQIAPRHAILRAFVSIQSGGDYQVMPGGLTRVAPNEGTLAVSNQAGGVSKDTLVMAEQPEHHVSLWLQPQPDQLIQPQTRALPSRAADNLFWVGRYLERTEAVARLLRTVLRKRREVHQFGESETIASLHTLLRATTHVTDCYPGFVGEAGAALLEAPNEELIALFRDAGREGSLAFSLQAFHTTAGSVGDLWSSDSWRLVNALEEEWQEAMVMQVIDDDRALFHLDQLILKLMAFNGLIADNLVREPGWVMLDIGRRLERALTSIALWRATLVPKHGSGTAQQVMEAVLTVCESLLTYRRRYRSFMHLPTVLELLLMDTGHPRGLVFQLKRLKGDLDSLPRSTPGYRLDADQRLLLEAETRLVLSDPTRLAAAGSDAGVFQALDDLLADLAETLWSLSDQLTLTYFSHVQETHLQQAEPAIEE